MQAGEAPKPEPVSAASKKRMRLESKRARQTTAKYRLAKNTRQKQEKCKLKKRAFDNSSDAKLARLLRRRVQFWAPCLFNWSRVRSSKSQATMAANAVAPYAPRLYRDGRIANDDNCD